MTSPTTHEPGRPFSFAYFALLPFCRYRMRSVYNYSKPPTQGCASLLEDADMSLIKRHLLSCKIYRLPLVHCTYSVCLH